MSNANNTDTKATPTLTSMLLGVLTGLLEKSKRTLAEKAERLAGGQVLSSQEILEIISAQETLKLLAGGVNWAGQDEERVEDLATRLIETAEEQLLGSAGWGPGRGPWAANSTCPVANLENVEQANAYRVIRSGLKRAMADHKILAGKD